VRYICAGGSLSDGSLLALGAAGAVGVAALAGGPPGGSNTLLAWGGGGGGEGGEGGLRRLRHRLRGASAVLAAAAGSAWVCRRAWGGASDPPCSPPAPTPSPSPWAALIALLRGGERGRGGRGRGRGASLLPDPVVLCVSAAWAVTAVLAGRLRADWRQLRWVLAAVYAHLHRAGGRPI